MRSRSYLFLGLVVALSVLSAVLYNWKDYKMGLDVQGGVRFTLRMVNLTAEHRDPQNFVNIKTSVQRILETRSQGIGVVEASVQVKEPDSFIVELPGFTNADEARFALQTSASLKFYSATNVVSPTRNARRYTIERDAADPNNPQVVFVEQATGETIEPRLADGTKNPKYLEIVKAWGDPILEGGDLARASYQPAGESYIPTLEFSADGAQKMRTWSSRNRNSQENLAIVLDDVVISIAPLEQGAVISDQGVITGTFTTQYVTRLRDLLNSGRLPVDLEEASFQQVQPTIGKQALDMMITAGLIAFAATALFLIIYYAFPGFVALIALGLYILFTLTVLKLLGATFSLAAIAGFILSIGMAVDANILVFERFKEEMKAGKSLVAALDLGFRRALPAIVDSNACTILTSIVLANLGTGPVKGFAVTLIIGVVVSLFTAITVTRSLLFFLVASGIGDNPKWYALERGWFGEHLEQEADTRQVKIVERSKTWFTISLISIVIGVPFMFMGGLKPNVEFQGGYEVSLALKGKNLTTAQIADRLEENGIEGANVKLAGQGDTTVAMVTVPPAVAGPNEETAEVVQKVATAAGFNPEQLENGGDVAESAKVGETVRAETIRNAILGVILSTALIVLYLAFRFGVALGNFVAGLRFGLSAVGALVHDVIVVLGVTAIVGFIFNWEVSALFITSMLTVIGFSVHDTIVIFDRIRENLRKPLRGENFDSLVNRSVTQSIARSINTGITVIATLLILLFFGTTTPDLKLFVVTMLAGIVSGTYSSIFNAAPILAFWDRLVGKNKGEHSTLMGMAAAEASRARAAQISAAREQATTVRDTTGKSYGTIKRRSGVNDVKRPTDEE